MASYGVQEEALRRNAFAEDSEWQVELRGVDICDPLGGEEVAAWFLDADYDGMTFQVSQAFFPGDPDAWEKLQRAARAQIDPDAFEKMRGTVSFPFTPGEHQRIAVTVIDFGRMKRCRL